MSRDVRICDDVMYASLWQVSGYPLSPRQRENHSWVLEILCHVDTGRVNISPVQTSLRIIQSEKDSLDSWPIIGPAVKTLVTGTWVNNCYLLTQHLPWRNLRGPWRPGLLTPEKSAASDQYLQRWQNRENRYHRQPATSHSQFLFPLAVTVTAVPAQCWSTSLQSISIWQLAAPFHYTPTDSPDTSH